MQWTEIIDCDQNSAEWYLARLGLPTASEFATIRTGGNGDTRRRYMHALIAERLTGEPTPRGETAAMRRGHDLEEWAVRAYELLTDEDTEAVGFIKNHRSDCGASPDRVVGEAGLVEIKTKAPYLQVGVLDKGAVPSEHLSQLQGQLWIAEREWVDFVSYCPGLPLFVQRVHRDEGYIESIRRDVERFYDELLAVESRVRNAYQL